MPACCYGLALHYNLGMSTKTSDEKKNTVRDGVLHQPFLLGTIENSILKVIYFGGNTT